MSTLGSQHFAEDGSNIPRDIPAGSLKQPSIPDDPAQAAMYKLLGSRIKCTLADGRTATGTFICMDRLKNIILTEVLEERTINPIEYGSSTANNSFPVQRELAQAMIPGKHLVKAEIEKDVYDKLLK